MACSSKEGDAASKSNVKSAVEDGPPVQIEDLKEGTGAAVKHADWITVQYTGWLPDGTKFDSSYDFQQPFSFRVGDNFGEAVSKGWNRGLIGMRVGGKRKLTIPAELAQGKVFKEQIPPKSPVIFEIELIRID